VSTETAPAPALKSVDDTAAYMMAQMQENAAVEEPVAEPAAVEEPTAEEPPVDEQPLNDDATVDEAQPEETDDEGTEDETQAQTEFMGMLKEHYGEDLSSKYKDDSEAIRGLLEARRALGRKLENEEYGRLYRDNESDFHQFLTWRQQAQQAQQTQQQTAPAQQPAEQPITPEQAELWMTQVTRDPESGELRSVPGADPDVVNRVQDYNRRVRQAVHDLAYSPDKIVGQYIAPHIEKLKQDIQQTWQQNTQQSLQQVEVEKWFGENSSWLFQDGDASRGYTHEGQIFEQDFVEPLMAQVETGKKSMPEVLEQAMKMMQRAAPQTPKRKPSPRAVHKPALANPAAQGEPQPEPEWENGDSLESYMMKLMKHRDNVVA